MSQADIQFQFDNAFIRDLPLDAETDNYMRQVERSCSSLVNPREASGPQLLAYSSEVLDLLDLSEEQAQSQQFADVFTGNQLVPGMQPYAMCYGGHQFGSWAGQLGDGRAINLGEIINNKNERWILQLKGAGQTPYSRRADGLAVLRSSVREFLCSEAMFHLGVPTTRALSLCLTGDEVMRDMLYDGNPAYEPGAVVCRVAQSFTRFGNFQIFAARKDYDTLRALCEYTIQTDYPHLYTDSGITQDTYLQWYREICQRTQDMIIHWFRVGFVHGVMNTDNMSILGQTIDYGPYGWLEGYDLDWTPNTTDAASHRYAFGRQADIACWNLAQLANAIAPIVEKTSALEEVLNQVYADMNIAWKTMMAEKLGFQAYDADGHDELIQGIVEVLQLIETDYCIFFRKLSQVSTGMTAEDALVVLAEAFYLPEQNVEKVRDSWLMWLTDYIAAIDPDDASRVERMNACNPKYVLRNYLAQEAIDLATDGDYSRIHALLEVLRRPYDEQPDQEQYSAKRPDWARDKPGCSMLSCSS